jgi:hypothetical protein
MSPGASDSLERMTPTELVGLVRRLLGEVERLRAQNEKVGAALVGLDFVVFALDFVAPGFGFQTGGLENVAPTRSSYSGCARLRPRAVASR